MIKIAPQYLLLGTYTTLPSPQGTRSRGVHLLEFTPEEGDIQKDLQSPPHGKHLSPGVRAIPGTTTGLTVRAVLPGIVNPSWVCVCPESRRFWVASEAPASTEDPRGRIYWCTMDPQGSMTIGGHIGSEGADPCHVSTSPDRTKLFVANYSGGNTSLFSIADDGSLSLEQVFPHGEASHRPLGTEPFEKPHGHCVQASPDGRWLWTADLGINSILCQDLHNSPANAHISKLAQSCPDGTGPRHFVLNKAGTRAWLLHEHKALVDSYAINGDTGQWELRQRCSSPGREVDHGNGPIRYSENPEPSPGGAAIKLNQQETRLYLSNRGDHNSISTFSVDPDTGHLDFLDCRPSGGRSPRDIALSPDGGYLLAAHQDSSNIAVHRLDPASGIPCGTMGDFSVPVPVCLAFLPASWNLEAKGT